MKALLLGVLILFGSAAVAADAPPTPIVPATPAAAPALKAAKITQYGITWTFDQEYAIGRYVTGDYWVVGPVTVTQVDPAPTPGRNGSVVNPKAGKRQSYDDRIPGYDAAPRAAFPLVFKPGESLVSTASLAKVGDTTPDTVPGQYARGPLRTAVVLTCVAEPPAADAFRPAYVGVHKTTWAVSQLRREFLPRLALPAGAKLPDLAPQERYLQRIWLDHLYEWVSREMHPLENMPDYGRELTSITSTVGLMLLVDDPQGQRENLLRHFVQLGIDYWGVVQSDNDLWKANGGHNAGRKWPILFAGLLLGDEGMRHMKAAFAEDEQTYYGKGYRGQTVLWLINPTVLHEEKPPEQWKGPPYQRDNDGWKSEGYRALNGPTWIGQALAARVMGAKTLWNHDAYFDYVDRWIAEAPNGEVDRQTLQPKSYKPFPNAFVEAMWTMYRPKADALGEAAAKKAGIAAPPADSPKTAPSAAP